MFGRSESYRKFPSVCHPQFQRILRPWVFQCLQHIFNWSQSILPFKHLHLHCPNFPRFPAMARIRVPGLEPDSLSPRLVLWDTYTNRNLIDRRSVEHAPVIKSKQQMNSSFALLRFAHDAHFTYIVFCFQNQMSGVEWTLFKNYVWILFCAFDQVRLESLFEYVMTFIIRTCYRSTISWRIRCHIFWVVNCSM